jgi:hypothetical protein
MSQPMCFLLCVLGSKAVLDVWFNGSIFSWHRAWAELLRDEGEWWLSRKFGELLTCRFCFSYHSSLWLSLFCLPILNWWVIVPWWLAVRTTTAFVDQLEQLIERKMSDGTATEPDATSGENPGAVHGSNGESLFD